MAGQASTNRSSTDDHLISGDSHRESLNHKKTTTPLNQSCSSQHDSAIMPCMPLYHLGMATILGSTSNFDKLQSAIDHLDDKAQAGLSFSCDEKAFMKELYEAFGWCGNTGRIPETAALADHYVNGNGQPLEVSSEPYLDSQIVNLTMEAMKSQIRDLSNNNDSFASFLSSDTNFRQSSHFKPLVRTERCRNASTEGYIRHNGLIYIEQTSQRLQKAGNCFYLKADTLRLSNGDYQTTWRVDNAYNFRSYSKDSRVTELYLNDNMTLRLPDGLSEYMNSGLGIANPFHYHAEWAELWR